MHAELAREFGVRVAETQFGAQVEAVVEERLGTCIEQDAQVRGTLALGCLRLVDREQHGLRWHMAQEARRHSERADPRLGTRQHDDAGRQLRAVWEDEDLRRAMRK